MQLKKTENQPRYFNISSIIFDECCVPKPDLPIVFEKEFLPTFAGKTIIRVFHDHEQAQISC